MTTPTIRRAVPADAETLSRIGAETFSETFGHLYPPQDLSRFLRTAYSLESTRADLADPTRALWLVEADGEAIGYALAGLCTLPHPDVTEDCGEVKRIYLRKGRQGGGLGGRLLAEALAWLERDGPRQLWIGVWSENHGAQRFYRRLGFEKAGEYFFDVGETHDLEFILRRRQNG
ncbi:MAG: GNAT family N-acetyltransferase [Caulobacter sp.]|nr:GNAT family N-acetyltransferase [Caulobacter sp.]